jgi:hypothetical protein
VKRDGRDRALGCLIAITAALIWTNSLAWWSASNFLWIGHVYLWCSVVVAWAVFFFGQNRGWNRRRIAVTVLGGGLLLVAAVAVIVMTRSGFRRGEFEEWGRSRDGWR